LITAKRQESGTTGNQFGVSPSYRNYCQPATRTASAICRLGTGTKVSMISRNRTQKPVRAHHGHGGERAPREDQPKHL
jgi:hypothetical protein